MITIFTGAPGTGKSAACVALISELAKGRTIYVNGIPDLAIPHEVLEDPTKWPEVVPDGCIIVIDEVQRIWRPRGPGQKVPPDIQALETHRHRGIDFYIITQGPRLIDSNIRALAGRHVHLRDVGILGRYWYEWPECADNCSTGWKTAPIKKRYRLPKHAFSLYKSASVHIKPIRSLPWMLVVMIVALLVTAFVGFRAYKIISSKLAPPEVQSVAPAITDASQPQAQGQPETAQVGEKMTVAEYVQSYTPRIAGLPYTAPRYDQITEPVTAPIPAACIKMKNRCDCYTQQGTKIQTPPEICQQIVAGGLFIEWDASKGAGASGGGGGAAAAVTATKTPMAGNPGQSVEVQLKPAPRETDNAQAVRDGQTLASMRPARSM